MRTALRPRMPRPWVVAHRGASHDRPENTAAAFDLALAEGCDGIELDLQLSADGVPVVYHDRTLARIGQRGRRVSALTLAELRRLDFGGWLDRRYHGEPILTLEEILSRYAGRTRLLLELKTRGRGDAEWSGRLARTVAAAVRRHRLEEAVFILCFESRVLAAAAAANPHLRCVRNLRVPVPRASVPPRGSPPLFALSIDVRGLTRRFVQGAHRRGKPVMVFTCNTPASVRAALTAGADVIMSDRPGWLADRLPSFPGGG